MSNRSVCFGQGCGRRSHRLNCLNGKAHITTRFRARTGDRPRQIRLLEAVRDHGSISAAGRSMDMSYQRAWLLIDELNELFEGPVIETKHGGAGGGGAQLTSLGHRVVEEYRSIETKAHAAVAAELAALAAATIKPLPNR